MNEISPPRAGRELETRTAGTLYLGTAVNRHAGGKEYPAHKTKERDDAPYAFFTEAAIARIDANTWAR